MVTDGAPTSGQVGRMYDEFTDFLANTMGGNIHLGYWHDERDRSSVEQATDRLTDLAADQLALVPGARVLDVGCGSGKPALRIARSRDVHVTGITVSAHQVQLARAFGQAEGLSDRVVFQRTDATRLPFADACFDRALAIESLLHISDQAAALREIARVLRPGGRLVVADLCLRAGLTDTDREVVARMSQQFLFASVIDIAQYRERAQAAGFETVAVADIGENVRPAYQNTVKMLRVAAGNSPESPIDLTAIAALVSRFGALAQVGYMLLTLQLPTGRP